MKITEHDLEILSELQKDAKQPLKKMSKKLKIPISTLHSRISKLEKAGVIKKYSAILDGSKVGMNFAAIIFCTLLFHDPDLKPITLDKIVKEVQKIPEIQSIYFITGQKDLILKLRSRDVDDVSRVVGKKLRMIPGIESSETYVCFDVVKDTLDLPI